MTEFESDLKEIVAAGKRVYLIGAHPIGPALDPASMIEREFKNPPLRFRKEDFNERGFLETLAPIHQRLLAVAKAAGATFIDTFPILCNPECLNMTDSRIPTYKDSTHIRSFYLLEKTKYVDKILE